MEKSARKRSPLAEAEREVLAEGQEWMRKRLEKRLQKLAEEEGEISPPEPAQAGSLPAEHDQPEDVRGMD